MIKDVWDNKVCKMALIKDPEGTVLMLHQIAPDRLKSQTLPDGCQS